MPDHSQLLFGFTLLAGGSSRCGPAWTKRASAIDHCYKLYFVTDGEASVHLKSGEDIGLAEGNAYFIPGHHLCGQTCRESMEVFWLHAVPDSLYLSSLLSSVSSVASWSLKSIAVWRNVYEQVDRLFDHAPPWLGCRTQAMMLDLVSRILQDSKVRQDASLGAVYQQLKPAIDYIDAGCR